MRNTRAFLDAHPVTFSKTSLLNPGAIARANVYSRDGNLGILRIGDVRALDRQALATRFGDIGRHVITLISGGDLEDAGESYPVHELTVERVSDPPLINLDQAAFLAREMAEELSSDLTRRGVIAREIAISTRSESGQDRERRWSLDVASPRDITDRVRWQLSAWMADGDEGPGSGIERIVVVAKAIAPAGVAQGTLWGADRGSRDAATRAVSRIQSLLGEQAVFVPERVGGRHPLESHVNRLWDAAETLPEHTNDPWPGALPEPWPNLVKAKPEKISVLDAHGHGASSVRLAFYCTEQYRSTPVVGIRFGVEEVHSLAGPWLQAVGWWNPQSQQRKAWVERSAISGDTLFIVRKSVVVGGDLRMIPYAELHVHPPTASRRASMPPSWLSVLWSWNSLPLGSRIMTGYPASCSRRAPPGNTECPR